MRLSLATFCILQRLAAASRLNLAEFQSVWTSEFDDQSHEDALESFESESAFMSEEIFAMSEMNLSGGVTTSDVNLSEMNNVGSLVCCSAKDESGYKRLEHLETQLSISIPLSTVLYNRADMTCAVTGVAVHTLSMASALDDEVIVAPLTSYMKLRANTVETLEEHHESDEDFKSLYVQLCQHPIDMESAAHNLISRIHEERDEMGRSLATQRFHWTRDDSPEHSKQHRSLTHVRRINRWREAMDLGINADHQCQSMFDDLSIDANEGNMGFLIGLGFGEAGDISSAASSHCTLSLVAALSAQPDVCSVENLRMNKLANDKAQWITQSGIEGSRPFWDDSLAGSGQIVQVSDSGLDTNNCYFYDASGEPDTSVNLNLRKVVQYSFTTQSDTASTYDDHGTHVVGSIVGHKSIDGTTTGETTGFADGSAREAKVSFFDVGLGTTCCAIPDATTLFAPGREAGARIHSASWGANTASADYTSFSQAFDEYIYNNDDMLFVVAAGNNGGGNLLQSITSPGTAKNSLTVGASMNFQLYAGSMDHVASFSGRGPTQDGRIKPDIIAPGWGILSASATPDEVNECDPRNYPSGSSGQKFDGVSFKSGTSMATPITSGNLAIIRQYLTDRRFLRNIVNPSAALMKAIIINGGVPLSGVYDPNGIVPTAPYDAHQGFGRVNLSRSLPLAGGNSFNADFKDRLEVEQGEAVLFTYAIKDTCGSDTSSFSVTLVWTDPSGTAGCTACLVNDLDLIVTNLSTRTTYYPNGSDQKDDTNNVERVQISVASGDNISVTVAGTNLISTAKFSLAVTGCIDEGDVSPTTPLPTKSPTKSPTAYPTLSLQPSIDPDREHTLVTTMVGGSGMHGNMFDLKALRDLSIVNFEIAIQQREEYSVEIYTLAGSFDGFARSADAWTAIGSSTVSGAGSRERVPLDQNDIDEVQITAGSTQAFYVTLPGRGYLSYTFGSNFGAVYASDDNLQFMQGSGIAYPFFWEFRPRIFNGAIVYITDPEEASSSPSLSISSSPSIHPTLASSSSPSSVGSDSPSASPSLSPSSVGSDSPTASHSLSPSSVGSGSPTASPSFSPSSVASDSPSNSPTSSPSSVASDSPTASPSLSPSSVGSDSPSNSLTSSPSSVGSDSPTASPSLSPSSVGSDSPSNSLTSSPSSVGSDSPTASPSTSPSSVSSESPTASLSSSPSSGNIYVRVLNLLNTYDPSMSEEEKNALIAQVRLILTDGTTYLSNIGSIVFEDERARLI